MLLDGVVGRGHPLEVLGLPEEVHGGDALVAAGQDVVEEVAPLGDAREVPDLDKEPSETCIDAQHH